jgi:hypothetical protein
MDTTIMPRTGMDSEVVAMNARGDVVGWMSFDPRYVSGLGGSYGFVRYADGYTDFLTDDRGTKITSGSAVAIDEAGLAYGSVGLLSTGALSSFALARGEQMSFFGDRQDVVMGVSPAGLRVGCRYSADNQTRPVVFRDGAAVAIAADLPAFRGCLVAANDAGIAVGGFHAAHEIGAYVWNGKEASPLPMEVAKSINASGRVVGAKVIGSIAKDGSDTIFVTRAALWLGGAEVQDLNALTGSGSDLSEAVAINDAGAIVGTGSKGAFLLTPRP